MWSVGAARVGRHLEREGCGREDGISSRAGSGAGRGSAGLVIQQTYRLNIETGLSRETPQPLHITSRGPKSVTAVCPRVEPSTCLSARPPSCRPTSRRGERRRSSKRRTRPRRCLRPNYRLLRLPHRLPAKECCTRSSTLTDGMGLRVCRCATAGLSLPLSPSNTMPLVRVTCSDCC